MTDAELKQYSGAVRAMLHCICEMSDKASLNNTEIHAEYKDFTITVKPRG